MSFNLLLQKCFPKINLLQEKLNWKALDINLLQGSLSHPDPLLAGGTRARARRGEPCCGELSLKWFLAPVELLIAAPGLLIKNCLERHLQTLKGLFPNLTNQCIKISKYLITVCSPVSLFPSQLHLNR